MDANQPTPAEFAREVFRRHLELLALDADVEQMVLAEVAGRFDVETEQDVMAFAA